MNIKERIEQEAIKAAQKLYGIEENTSVPVQKTRKEFEGDYTLVVFPFTKAARKKPEQIAEEIGHELQESIAEVEAYNVVKGFLNLKLTTDFWVNEIALLQSGGKQRLEKVAAPDKIMVEFSSPNTNKPLHLGHVRNNLLGYSIANILAARGHEVVKANLINDRGIHICKSMLAWQKSGKGETPENSGTKGDKLVAKYYVDFEREYQEEIKQLVAQGMEKDQAKREAPLLKEAQEMLRKWEAGDPEVLSLWKTMNGWVYEGHNKTYESLGVSFDQFYYESNTYLLGKDLINEGLEKGVFYKREDGSVWCDLTADGLDEKLVLRSDGTSVYMTQDIGTAELKYQDYHINRSIYVVGDEQEYHFKVLKLIMQKLQRPYANGIYHLSYGMIDLPTGRMKTREGTVVDADDMIFEMRDVARKQTELLGKTESLSEQELQALYTNLGLGALKYFLLKVDPKKRMVFNPEESIDFQGNTGPFIQYNFTRIKSVERKLGHHLASIAVEQIPDTLSAQERELCMMLYSLNEVLAEAENNYSPAVIANYCYELAKTFSSFYADSPVIREEDAAKRNFRLALIHQIEQTLSFSASLLGITLPEYM
ncbi:arginine--tRNA ligase [bacterium]|nr:arginine--tRNA ligase [bacterium]